MKVQTILACGLVAASFLSGCKYGGQGNRSTVTVSGTGTVSVAPDMARMTVSMNKTEQTTRQAQEAVGQMAGRVLAILKDSGIEDKDITTTSLRFNPEYDWSGGRSVLIGQRAEQSVEFTARGMGQDAGKVARIIDRLTAVDGIVVNQIDFSVDDNTEYFARSRELAFEKAVQKAQQYAALSGLRVGRVLAVSEDGLGNVVPVTRTATVNQLRMEGSVTDASSTVLPSGLSEITTRISVVFLLE